eukprot:CFRG6942T1
MEEMKTAKQDGTQHSSFELKNQGDGILGKDYETTVDREGSMNHMKDLNNDNLSEIIKDGETLVVVEENISTSTSRSFNDASAQADNNNDVFDDLGTNKIHQSSELNKNSTRKIGTDYFDSSDDDDGPPSSASLVNSKDVSESLGECDYDNKGIKDQDNRFESECDVKGDHLKGEKKKIASRSGSTGSPSYTPEPNALPTSSQSSFLEKARADGLFDGPDSEDDETLTSAQEKRGPSIDMNQLAKDRQRLIRTSGTLEIVENTRKDFGMVMERIRAKKVASNAKSSGSKSMEKKPLEAFKRPKTNTILSMFGKIIQKNDTCDGSDIVEDDAEEEKEDVDVPSAKGLRKKVSRARLNQKFTIPIHCDVGLVIEEEGVDVPKTTYERGGKRRQLKKQLILLAAQTKNGLREDDYMGDFLPELESASDADENEEDEEEDAEDPDEGSDGSEMIIPVNNEREIGSTSTGKTAENDNVDIKLSVDCVNKLGLSAGSKDHEHEYDDDGDIVEEIDMDACAFESDTSGMRLTNKDIISTQVNSNMDTNVDDEMGGLLDENGFIIQHTQQRRNEYKRQPDEHNESKFVRLPSGLFSQTLCTEDSTQGFTQLPAGKKRPTQLQSQTQVETQDTFLMNTQNIGDDLHLDDNSQLNFSMAFEQSGAFCDNNNHQRSQTNSILDKNFHKSGHQHKVHNNSQFTLVSQSETTLSMPKDMQLGSDSQMSLSTVFGQSSMFRKTQSTLPLRQASNISNYGSPKCKNGDESEDTAEKDCVIGKERQVFSHSPVRVSKNNARQYFSDDDDDISDGTDLETDVGDGKPRLVTKVIHGVVDKKKLLEREEKRKARQSKLVEDEVDVSDEDEFSSDEDDIEGPNDVEDMVNDHDVEEGDLDALKRKIQEDYVADNEKAIDEIKQQVIGGYKRKAGGDFEDESEAMLAAAARRAEARRRGYEDSHENSSDMFEHSHLRRAEREFDDIELIDNSTAFAKARVEKLSYMNTMESQSASYSFQGNSSMKSEESQHLLKCIKNINANRSSSFSVSRSKLTAEDSSSQFGLGRILSKKGSFLKKSNSNMDSNSICSKPSGKPMSRAKTKNQRFVFELEKKTDSSKTLKTSSDTSINMTKARAGIRKHHGATKKRDINAGLLKKAGSRGGSLFNIVSRSSFKK